MLVHRIQDIVMVQAFTEAQKSNLLAAFYPGYIIAMLPAGWAVQKFGAKLLLGLDNYLQGAALLLLPMAAKMGVMPVRPLSAAPSRRRRRRSALPLTVTGGRSCASAWARWAWPRPRSSRASP